MFTVIRFNFSDNQNALLSVGEKLNKIIPGAYTGEDKVKHRFSCSVTVAQDCDMHCQDIQLWLTKTATLIHEVRDLGVSVEVDCAIEPEDLQGRLLTSFMLTDELILKLAELHMSFLFSIYQIVDSALK